MACLSPLKGIPEMFLTSSGGLSGQAGHFLPQLCLSAGEQALQRVLCLIVLQRFCAHHGLLIPNGVGTILNNIKKLYSCILLLTLQIWVEIHVGYFRKYNIQKWRNGISSMCQQPGRATFDGWISIWVWTIFCIPICQYSPGLNWKRKMRHNLH